MNIKTLLGEWEPHFKNQIYEMAETLAMEDAMIRVIPDIVGFSAKHFSYIIPERIGTELARSVLVTKIEETDIDFYKLEIYLQKEIEKSMEGNRKIIPLLKNLSCYWDLTHSFCVLEKMATHFSAGHFLEIDRDENGDQWLVICLSPRLLGMEVQTIYQRRTIHDLKSGLSWLSEKEAKNYLQDMDIVCEIARTGIELVRNWVCYQFNLTKRESIHSIHNYIDQSNPCVPIMRRNMISAKQGEKLCVLTTDGCVLGIGKGKKDWNESAPNRIRQRETLQNLTETMEITHQLTSIFRFGGH